MASGAEPPHLFRVRNTFIEPLLALQDEHEEAHAPQRQRLFRTASDSTLHWSDKPVFEMQLPTPMALRETCGQSAAKQLVANDSLVAIRERPQDETSPSVQPQCLNGSHRLDNSASEPSDSNSQLKKFDAGESPSSDDTANNASDVEPPPSWQQSKNNRDYGTPSWSNNQHEGWRSNNWKQNNWRRGRDTTCLSKWGKKQWYEDSRRYDSYRNLMPISSQALPAAFSATPSPQPWFGSRHAFHEECESMGGVSEDMRRFTKVSFEGRLSLLSESHVLHNGEEKYLLRFSSGMISKADGVGFVFTNRLPCPKNIQKITSIFVNQRGQICLRVKTELVKFSVSLKPLDLGDVIGLSINLQDQRACFSVWPAFGGPATTADFSFREALNSCREKVSVNSVSRGCFACIVKNIGVSVQMLS